MILKRPIERLLERYYALKISRVVKKKKIIQWDVTFLHTPDCKWKAMREIFLVMNESRDDGLTAEQIKDDL